MYSTKDLAGNVSHHGCALSITAVGTVQWKVSSGRILDTLCCLCLHTHMCFVEENSDLHFSTGAVYFSCTEKLYGYMVYSKTISMQDIYLPFSLIAQSTLYSLYFSDILLRPPRGIRKSSFWKPLALFYFFSPLFSQVWNFL